MEVILLEKVANLGGLGEKVSVKSGFGRNFLIPKGKAVFASAENVKQFEARRAELEKEAADKLAAAEERKAGVEGPGRRCFDHAQSGRGRSSVRIGWHHRHRPCLHRGGCRGGEIRGASAGRSVPQCRRVRGRAAPAYRCERDPEGHGDRRRISGSGFAVGVNRPKNNAVGQARLWPGFSFWADCQLVV